MSDQNNPVARRASEEALAFTKAHGMGWCAGEGIPHDGPHSSKRCGPCYTALMLDEFASERVRLAVERACAAVCGGCEEGLAVDKDDSLHGYTHVYDYKKRRLCDADPIRRAFAAQLGEGT